jgi:hypothetical protein
VVYTVWGIKVFLLSDFVPCVFIITQLVSFADLVFESLHQSALQGISMLRDSKYGQYINLPQNLVVYSQLMGCTVGSLASLVVLKSILKNKRDVLLSPSGDGVFSGAQIAAFQARSVRYPLYLSHGIRLKFAHMTYHLAGVSHPHSWGIFSRRMFLFGQKYVNICFCLILIARKSLSVGSSESAELIGSLVFFCLLEE